MTQLRQRGVEVELKYDAPKRLRSLLSDTNQRQVNEAIAALQENADANISALDPDKIDNVDAANASTPNASSGSYDNNNPLSIFDAFMKLENSVVNMTTDLADTPDAQLALNEDSNVGVQLLHQLVYKEGVRTLEALMEAGSKDDETASVGAIAKRSFGSTHDLRLEHITLRNFGPFGGDDNSIRYPLAGRGLVLIRGDSTDGTGADSNGAGKTTLAMSAMWALNGGMDPRLVSDGKMTDVAFDSGDPSKKYTAEVDAAWHDDV
jgi:hypothetical protein